MENSLNIAECFDNLASSFRGKTAIITGGGSGIGQTVAHFLAGGGANVFSMDLDHRSATSDCLESGRLRLITGSVCDEAECERTVQEAVSRTGRLDILVNCAGIVERTVKTIRQDSATWQKTIDVNLGGTYRMSKAAAVAMVELRNGAQLSM